MSIASMTGFARAEGAQAGWSWIWEARAVNGRGLDVRVRLATGFDDLEKLVKAAAKRHFRRGNIQISLSCKREDTSPQLKVNESLARTLLQSLQGLVDDGLARPARIDGVLAVRGVVEPVQPDPDPDEMEKLHLAITAGLDALFAALARARADEGAATAAVLLDVFNAMEGLVAQARACSGAQSQQIKETLEERITDILKDTKIEPQRLAQEAALMAVKADVREELDRLDGHIAAARALMQASEPVGRKLEFMAQEFNREANTLCSKSSDMALTQIGLDLKTLIDQLREHAANVE